MMRRNNKRMADYNQKEYKNPYYQIKRKKGIKASSSGLSKIKLYFFVFLVLSAAAVWGVFFSGYFNVRNLAINISATEGGASITENEIKDIIWKQTGENGFSLQKNTIFFNLGRLKKSISDKYCLESVEASKKYPDIIKVDLKEKNYAIIWIEDDKYYYADIGGRIISETSPEEIQSKDYPVIQNKSEAKISGNQTAVGSDMINFVMDIYNELVKRGNNEFKINKFVVDGQYKTAKALCEQGPEIIFNADMPLDKQINKLQALKKENLKDDFFKKSYVNLRYGDWIYYR